MPTFGFNKEGVTRIVNAVRNVERATVGSVKGNGPPGALDYPTPLHIGKLTTPLTSTGSGTVTVWGATQASTSAETAFTGTLTVHKWGSINLSSGDAVKVWRHNGSGRLYADGVGRAQFIEFTLNNTLTSTDSSPSVTRTGYWHGTDPGDSPTVSNPPASAGFVFSGETGYSGGAVWDDEFGSYRIIWIEPPRSSDFATAYFTPVSTALTSTAPVVVTFFSDGGKVGAAIESSVIINFLNSDNIEGYSTAVAVQLLAHTSTGLRFIIDADHCWIGIDSSGIFHKCPFGSTVQANCATVHNFDVSDGLCRIAFDDAGHLHGMMTFASTYLSPWGFSDPA